MPGWGDHNGSINNSYTGVLPTLAPTITLGEPDNVIRENEIHSGFPSLGQHPLAVDAPPIELGRFGLLLRENENTDQNPRPYDRFDLDVQMPERPGMHANIVKPDIWPSGFRFTNPDLAPDGEEIVQVEARDGRPLKYRPSGLMGGYTYLGDPMAGPSGDPPDRPQAMQLFRLQRGTWWVRDCQPGMPDQGYVNPTHPMYVEGAIFPRARMTNNSAIDRWDTKELCT